MVLKTFLQKSLKELKENGLYNEIDVLQSANGPIIEINNEKYINLSSNNYLGLATDQRLKEVAKESIEQWGVGAGAVRTINGTRSEEHTSELQSRFELVCRHLLEK